MAFTYDVTTDRGKVRFLCQDTASGTALLQDDEIDEALTLTGSVYGAAALCLRVIATNKARIAVAIKTGKFSKDTKTLPDFLMKLADKIESGNVKPESVTAEQTPTDFAAEDFLNNEAARGNV